MRRRGPFVLTAAALVLASCLDDPAVRERAGLDELGRPLPAGSQPAGEGPAPVPTRTDERTPGPSSSSSVLPFPSGEAPPTAGPSATPVPAASGEYVRTFDPLDAAIAGPGFFVLSTQPAPTSMNDLLFTRRGNFDLVFVPEAQPSPGSVLLFGPGTWRLQTPEGYHVLGFDFEGPEGVSLPPESASTNFEIAFTLAGGGGRSVRAAPITLDSRSNPNLLPSWNFKGQLLSLNGPPLGLEGEPRQIYLAVAQLDHPGALQARPALEAYDYRLEAGTVRVGIAGVKPGEAQLPRPVGEANTILPATLER